MGCLGPSYSMSPTDSARRMFILKASVKNPISNMIPSRKRGGAALGRTERASQSENGNCLAYTRRHRGQEQGEEGRDGAGA